jgi:hypothetical protein
MFNRVLKQFRDKQVDEAAFWHKKRQGWRMPFAA